MRHALQTNVKFKLVIPEYLEYFNCKIANYETEYRDHTGDIYYRIELIEERQGASTTVDLATGLLNRL